MGIEAFSKAHGLLETTHYAQNELFTKIVVLKNIAKHT